MEGAISRMIQSLLAPPRPLSAEVERFQAVRENTLGILQQVSPKQALWSARPGSWSIAQIADHLLRSEELYREQFQRLIQMARDRKGGTIQIRFEEVDTSFAMIPREVLSMFEMPLRMVNFFVPHALREAMVRYPVVNAINPRVSEPRAGLMLEKLRADLAASLVETTKLFAGPLPPNLDQVTVSHPALGNNTPVELVRIMIAHEERHQGQMQSIRESANFPKTAASPA
jgi:uncharacterized damage-inducible protein DinB